MQRSLICIAALALGWLVGSPRRGLDAQVTNGTELVNPVSVTLTSPAPGSTISNTITLSADAGSLDGPMQRIEFWDSNNTTHAVMLMATVTNRNAAPTNLRVGP